MNSRTNAFYTDLPLCFVGVLWQTLLDGLKRDLQLRKRGINLLNANACLCQLKSGALAARLYANHLLLSFHSRLLFTAKRRLKL